MVLTFLLCCGRFSRSTFRDRCCFSSFAYLPLLLWFDMMCLWQVFNISIIIVVVCKSKICKVKDKKSFRMSTYAKTKSPRKWSENHSSSATRIWFTKTTFTPKPPFQVDVKFSAADESEYWGEDFCEFLILLILQTWDYLHILFQKCCTLINLFLLTSARIQNFDRVSAGVE